MARGEHEIPATGSWLTRAEVARADGLRFTKRRTEYLLRRWVCKQAVTAATGMPNDLRSLARVEVANHPSGAPFVRVDGAPLALGVSLSDRAGWAVCVVTQQQGAVGCDLELVEPRSEGFVADFLTPKEQEYVASRPDPDRQAAANLIWSAKESALKVLRTGLRRDTRSVEVTVASADDVGRTPGGWAGFVVRTAEGGVIPGWWRRDGLFLLTVASSRPHRAPSTMAGSLDLAGARPTHSWLTRPVSTQQ
jgi:4'-phosphopantetheinyl transferase